MPICENTSSTPRGWPIRTLTNSSPISQPSAVVRPYSFAAVTSPGTAPATCERSRRAHPPGPRRATNESAGPQVLTDGTANGLGHRDVLLGRSEEEIALE